MKILFLSHGSLEFDGRLRELSKVWEILGETEFIVRTSDDQKMTKTQKRINRSYPFFIVYSLYRYLKKRNVDIVFIDNRKASIPGLIIKTLFRPKRLVYDARELYIQCREDHFSRKVGNFFESRLIRKADIIICANDYRADIMLDYYKLKDRPLVFDNIRKLNYEAEGDHQKAQEKFHSIISRDKFRIISTSGHIISRTNDKLVKSLIDLGDEFDLLLVGGGSNKDKEIILSMIKENHLDNVFITGLVNQSELKYLVSQSHLGIVNYHDLDLNNKFCASGKIFEFVFEGLPVVTTENKPLTDLIDKHAIGLADNNYTQAILGVYQNYPLYKENVKKYSQTLSIKENNQQLAYQINERLNKLSK